MEHDNITDAINRIEATIGTLSQEVLNVRRMVELAGLVPATTGASGRLKLHEAMAVALRQRGNQWTKIADLAEMINAQELYAKGDGSRVEPNQLHARANRPTYRVMFEKEGPMIRLAEGGTG